MTWAATESAAPAVGPELQSTSPATFWALFSCALTVLSLLWLPTVLLQQADALLVFASPVEIWRDVALMMLLSIVPAASLASLGWLVATNNKRFFNNRRSGERLAWALVLVPVFWLFLWQLARASWLWIKLVTQHQLAITPQLKVAAIVLLLIALVPIWKSQGTTRVVNWLLEKVHSLRFATLLVMLGSALFLGLHPAHLLGWDAEHRSRPSDGQAKRPNILVISLDALAAQDAQVCGTGPTLMPRLRQFAAEASCFSRLYAASNYTTPSTSTMETGTLPWSHFANQISAKVINPLQSHTVAQALKSAGYQTLSVTDNQLASPRHHGTYRGYDRHPISPSSLLRDKLRAVLTFIPDSSLPLLVDSALSFLGAFDTYLQSDVNPFEANRVYAQALEMLDDASPDQAQYLWVHTMPPHSPYLPPPNTKYKLLPAGQLDHWSQFFEENIAYAEVDQANVDKHRLRYQESIMAADADLGAFLDTLERKGRLSNTLIVITADHGESFERGFLGHAGPMLHEALIHIPLVVKMPGQKQGRIVDMPASQADLAPTLIDFAKATPLPHAEGRSLMPFLLGRQMLDAPIFSMTLERQSRYQPLSGGNFAVIEGKFKLVKHLPIGQRELYDLNADPKEQIDIANRYPDIAKRMDELVQAQLRAAELRRVSYFGS
jgi:arylsulfatase A-like enzyme